MQDNKYEMKLNCMVAKACVYGQPCPMSSSCVCWWTEVISQPPSLKKTMQVSCLAKNSLTGQTCWMAGCPAIWSLSGTYRDLSGTVCLTYQKPIRSYLGYLGIPYLKPIRFYLKPIWSLSEPIWAYLGLFGTPSLDLSEPIWLYLGLFGHTLSEPIRIYLKILF